MIIAAKTLVSASANEAWKIISQINNDPQYWKGMMKLRNISKNRNVFVREVILKNGDKCYQKIILFPMDGIHIRWMKGSINGTKDIILTPMGKQTLLQVEMNYKIRGIASLFSREVSEDLRNEAELAIQLIKEELEKRQFFLIDTPARGPLHG